MKMSKISGAVLGKKSGGAGVLSKKISNTGVVRKSSMVSAVVSGGKSFSA